jgi:Tfp pilus assembly PilM family ATPase
MLKLGRFQPPVRRVLAIDAGARCLKLALVESRFGRFRVRKEEFIDLHAEGLVSADETREHLQELLEQWGRPPIAVVLPQHLSTSQVLDLPVAPESEIEKLVLQETTKLAGVSDSRIVYDFIPTDAAAKNRQRFWITVAREGEIRDRIVRLGVEQEDICEVTTTANALITAYRASSPLTSRAILVHLGAQSTVVAILLGGRCALAASFQMGGDFFTRALARQLDCPEEQAEKIKRERNLFSGEFSNPEFIVVVDGWVSELQQELKDWFEANPVYAPEAGSFELVASGGGFDQPGLLEYLREVPGLKLLPWPRDASRDMPPPSDRFEVAYGAALQALGCSPQPVSLLPEENRLGWLRLQGRQKVEFGSALLGLICLLILGVGTWHQAGLLHKKQALLQKVRAALDSVNLNDELTDRLAYDYGTLRPLLAAEQNTLDTLRTLAVLQTARTNRPYWYGLLADQVTYFSLPSVTTTNKPLRTNVVAVASDHPPASGPATNAPPARPGMIAELSVPEGPEVARALLSQLVNQLKREDFLAKADLLSDDLKRNLSDPKVSLPDRQHVLALDFATTEFQHPVQLRRSAAPLPVRGTGKRAGVFPRDAGEMAERGASAP